MDPNPPSPAVTNEVNENLSERIKSVLVNNGVDTEGGSFHSWRCFDKERYPEPCTCTDDVVAEVMEVVNAVLRARETHVAGETVARLSQWQEAPREGFQW